MGELLGPGMFVSRPLNCDDLVRAAHPGEFEEASSTRLTRGPTVKAQASPAHPQLNSTEVAKPSRSSVRVKFSMSLTKLPEANEKKSAKGQAVRRVSGKLYLVSDKGGQSSRICQSR